MPIYPGRRAGTWRVVVWAHRKSHEEIFEGTRDAALDHEARMRLALRASSPSPPMAAPSFSSFCVAEYEPHAEQHLGANTWHRTRVYVVASLSRFFGETRLSDFTTELVDEFKTDRLKSIKPGCVNNELKALATILRWAKEERGQRVADFKIRLLPGTGVKRVSFWTEPEVRKILAVAERVDPALYPVLLFLLNTGCRKGESIAAEWSWVDARARLLRIPVTEYWRPKSARPREVPIGDVLWAALRSMPRRTRWLFPTYLGDHFSRFPDERLRIVLKAAGLRGSPHWARHTYASHFLQTLPDLFLLAEILGHSHTRVTELYSHLLPEHLARARNAVNLGGPVKHRGETMAKRRAS